MLTGCAQHLAITPTQADGFVPWTNEPSAHHLAGGDEIELRFTLDPEMNDHFIIGPEGQVSVPLLGPVDAAGMTVAEFTATLKRRYASVLRVADVDVLLRGYGSERIFVGGEVKTPGAETITGPTDVLQAVLLAGGVLPTARLDEVVVLRRRADHAPMLRTVNLAALIGTGAPEQSLHLQPYDVVYVPRSGIAEFDLFIDQYLNQGLPFGKSINANIGNGVLVK